MKKKKIVFKTFDEYMEYINKPIKKSTNKYFQIGFDIATQNHSSNSDQKLNSDKGLVSISAI